jgi:hypothetical protein
MQSLKCVIILRSLAILACVVEKLGLMGFMYAAAIGTIQFKTYLKFSTYCLRRMLENTMQTTIGTYHGHTQQETWQVILYNSYEESILDQMNSLTNHATYKKALHSSSF